MKIEVSPREWYLLRSTHSRGITPPNFTIYSRAITASEPYQLLLSPDGKRVYGKYCHIDDATALARGTAP
jgi:hypothetical protein